MLGFFCTGLVEAQAQAPGPDEARAGVTEKDPASDVLVARQPDGDETPSESSAAAPDPAPRAAQDGAVARRLVDELELDAIAITGNDELPRIMHIVPWKSAQPGEVPGRPADSLINDIISPVDRREYRRQLRYREALAETPTDR